MKALEEAGSVVPWSPGPCAPWVLSPVLVSVDGSIRVTDLRGTNLSGVVMGWSVKSSGTKSLHIFH